MDLFSSESPQVWTVEVSGTLVREPIVESPLMKGKCSYREWPSIPARLNTCCWEPGRPGSRGDGAEPYLSCTWARCYCRENKNVGCWLSPLEQIERGRGHSWTLIRPHVSASPASIVPLILWARLSLLLQSFLPSLLLTPYSECKGRVPIMSRYARRPSPSSCCISTKQCLYSEQTKDTSIKCCWGRCSSLTRVTGSHHAFS